MTVGSFIGGSTPLGGGVVAFPVATLLLELTPAQGRDMSALIQVGAREGYVGSDSGLEFQKLCSGAHVCVYYGLVLSATIFPLSCVPRVHVSCSRSGSHSGMRTCVCWSGAFICRRCRGAETSAQYLILFPLVPQSVGLSAASYLISMNKRQLLKRDLIVVNLLFGTVGLILGLSTNPEPFISAFVYSTFVLCFAILYCYFAEVGNKMAGAAPRSGGGGKQSSAPVPPVVPPAPVVKKPVGVVGGSTASTLSVVSTASVDSGQPQSSERTAPEQASVRPQSGSSELVPLEQVNHKKEFFYDFVIISAYALGGVTGGVITANCGVGSGGISYCVCVLSHNVLVPKMGAGRQLLTVPEMTASSVVIMASVSVVLAVLRVSSGEVEKPAIYGFLAAAPVVCLGAPLGSMLLTPAREKRLRLLFYAVALLQFVGFAALKIRDQLEYWVIVVVSLLFTLGMVFLHYRGSGVAGGKVKGYPS